MRRDDDLVRAERAQRVLDRLQRVGVADLAACVDARPRASRARLASSRSCAAGARVVLVRGPVLERRVERRRDDEHLLADALGALVDQRRAACCPPTVSFAITRIRRSSSRAAPRGAVWHRALRLAARRRATRRRRRRQRRRTPRAPSHLLISARDHDQRRSTRSSASRKRYASASLRNGFCITLPRGGRRWCRPRSTLRRRSASRSPGSRRRGGGPPRSGRGTPDRRRT